MLLLLERTQNEGPTHHPWKPLLHFGVGPSWLVLFILQMCGCAYTKRLLSDVYINGLILKIVIAIFSNYKNIFWRSFFASSTTLSSFLSALHYILWQTCNTTEFPLPYCWTFRLFPVSFSFFFFSVSTHSQCCNNMLLCASWSTCASNSLDGRKVKFLKQWVVCFSYAVSSCCSF